MAVDKRNHAQEGDILVDDQRKHAHLWEAAGGIFIHHQDAESTIAQLAELGVPVRDPEQHEVLRWLSESRSPLTVTGAVEAWAPKPFLIPVSSLTRCRIMDTMHVEACERGNR